MSPRRDVSEKYFDHLHEVDVFNASMAWDLDEVARWQERHGVEMKDEPVATFQKYLERDHAILMSLVEHPEVPDPERFVACSIILQRAVIFFARGRETLYLRSYFHSAADSENFVNFVPGDGLEISFAADSLWYPLELSQFIQESSTQVVLDIVTEKPFDAKKLPGPFALEKRGRMRYGVDRYHLARVTGRLEAGEEVPDLVLAM